MPQRPLTPEEQAYIERLYGPTAVETPVEAPKPVSNVRTPRAGVAPKVGALLARIAGNVVSTPFAAVPGIGTVVAGGIGGGAEVAAQKLESPDPVDTTDVGIESALSMVPFGKIVKPILGTGGLAAKEAMKNAVRMGGYVAAGDAARRYNHTGSIIPKTPEEWAFAVGSPLIGGLLAKGHSKFDEMDLGGIDAFLKGKKKVKPEPVGTYTGRAVSELNEPTGKFESVTASAPIDEIAEALPATLPQGPGRLVSKTGIRVGKSNPPDAVDHKNTTEHHELNRAVTDDAPELKTALDEIDRKFDKDSAVFYKNNELDSTRPANEILTQRHLVQQLKNFEAAREQAKVEARIAFNKKQGSKEQKQLKAEERADFQNLKQEAGGTDVRQIAADQAKAAQKQAAAEKAEQRRNATEQRRLKAEAEKERIKQEKLDRAAEAEEEIKRVREENGLTDSRTSVSETTENVPTPTGKLVMRTIYTKPAPPKEDKGAGTPATEPKQPTKPGEGGIVTIPRSNPEFVGRNTYESREAAVEALAGSGRTGNLRKVGKKGRWQVILDPIATDTPTPKPGTPPEEPPAAGAAPVKPTPPPAPPAAPAAAPEAPQGPGRGVAPIKPVAPVVEAEKAVGEAPETPDPLPTGKSGLDIPVYKPSITPKAAPVVPEASKPAAPAVGNKNITVNGVQTDANGKPITPAPSGGQKLGTEAPTPGEDTTPVPKGRHVVAGIDKNGKTTILVFNNEGDAITAYNGMRNSGDLYKKIGRTKTTKDATAESLRQGAAKQWGGKPEDIEIIHRTKGEPAKPAAMGQTLPDGRIVAYNELPLENVEGAIKTLKGMGFKQIKYQKNPNGTVTITVAQRTNAATKPVTAAKPTPAATRKGEKDAITRDEVAKWTPEQIADAKAKYPKDKRIQTIIADEMKKRDAGGPPPEPTGGAPVAPKSPTPAPVAPKTGIRVGGKQKGEEPKAEAVETTTTKDRVNKWLDEQDRVANPKGPFKSLSDAYKAADKIREEGGDNYVPVDMKDGTGYVLKTRVEADEMRGIKPKVHPQVGPNEPATDVIDGTKASPEGIRTTIVARLKQLRDAAYAEGDTSGVKPVIIEVKLPTSVFRLKVTPAQVLESIKQFESPSAAAAFKPGYKTPSGISSPGASKAVIVDAENADGLLLPHADIKQHSEVVGPKAAEKEHKPNAITVRKIETDAIPPEATHGVYRKNEDGSSSLIVGDKASVGRVAAQINETYPDSSKVKPDELPEGKSWAQAVKDSAAKGKLDLEKFSVGLASSGEVIPPVKGGPTTSPTEGAAPKLTKAEAKLKAKTDAENAAFWKEHNRAVGRKSQPEAKQAGPLESAAKVSPEAAAVKVEQQKAAAQKQPVPVAEGVPTTKDGKTKAQILEQNGIDPTIDSNKLELELQAAGDRYFQLKEQAKTDPSVAAELRAAGTKFGQLKAAKTLDNIENGVKPTPVEPKAIPAPKGKGPTSDDVANMPPDKQEATLRQVVEDFKKGKFGNETGAITQQMAIRLGLAVPSALYGATTTPEEPWVGAFLYGSAGFFAPSVFRAAANGASSPAAKHELANYVWDKLEVLKELTPDLYRSFLLAKPSSLMTNSWIGPWGSGVMFGLEQVTGGDRALGVRVLKNMLPNRWGRGYRAHLKEARSRVFDANERGDMTAQINNPLLKTAISAPATAMTAGDMATRAAIMGAGAPEAVARAATLTSEPFSGFMKAIGNFRKTKGPHGKQSFVGRMALPFYRTSANQIEQSILRWPVAGAVFRKYEKQIPASGRMQIAQAALTGSAGVVGYALGYNVPLPAQPYVLKMVNNFFGPYGMSASAGFLAGSAHKNGGTIREAVTSSAKQLVTDGLPLPTMDTFADILRFGNQAIDTLDGGPAPQLPYGFIPPPLSSRELESIPTLMRGVAGEKDWKRPTKSEYSVAAPFINDKELKPKPPSEQERARNRQREELRRQHRPSKEIQEEQRRRRQQLRDARR